MRIDANIEDSEVTAACIGAASALVVAMFVPAAIVIGIGAAVAGGIYAYNKYSGDDEKKTDEKPAEEKPAEEKPTDTTKTNE